MNIAFKTIRVFCFGVAIIFIPFNGQLIAQESASKKIVTTHSNSSVSTDIEVGDPGLQAETIQLTPAQKKHISNIVNAGLSKGTEIDHKKFAIKMVDIAHLYVGMSRKHNQYQISQFLKLFGLDYADKHSGKPYPYCAAGVSFVACQAYCTLEPYAYDRKQPLIVFKKAIKDINHYYFLPNPACAAIQEDAKHRKDKNNRPYWISQSEVEKHNIKIQKGWLVLFNWHDGNKPLGVAEHVGIVVNAVTNGLHTIEFNTSDKNNSDGGAVAERTPEKRPYKYVVGYVRTYIQ